MYIIANETKVEITNYVVNRYDNSRGLVLSIYTTKDNISLIDFDTFCTSIMNSKTDILVYDDSDVLEKTLRGFHHNCFISLDNGVLSAEITNESENTYQIGILQDKNAELEIAELQHANEIIVLDNKLVETTTDLTDAQLALVEQYQAKIELEETILSLQTEIADNKTKIQNLETIITDIQSNK